MKKVLFVGVCLLLSVFYTTSMVWGQDEKEGVKNLSIKKVKSMTFTNTGVNYLCDTKVVIRNEGKEAYRILKGADIRLVIKTEGLKVTEEKAKRIVKADGTTEEVIEQTVDANEPTIETIDLGRMATGQEITFPCGDKELRLRSFIIGSSAGEDAPKTHKKLLALANLFGNPNQPGRTITLQVVIHGEIAAEVKEGSWVSRGKTTVQLDRKQQYRADEVFK